MNLNLNLNLHSPFQCGFRRQASTLTSGQSHFPFPKHPRPSPHEIFHLPRTATPTEIKSRYYDLVRYHHPDSPYARSHTPNASQRNTRFQSILSAYNTLRSPSSNSSSSSQTHWAKGAYGHGPGFDPYMAELNRRRKTYEHSEYLKRQREEKAREEEGKENDNNNGSRDKVVVGLAVLALMAGLYPSLFLMPFHMEQRHKSAAVNLSQARNDAQNVGHARREEVRRRVKDIKASRSEDEANKSSNEDGHPPL